MTDDDSKGIADPNGAKTGEANATEDGEIAAVNQAWSAGDKENGDRTRPLEVQDPTKTPGKMWFADGGLPTPLLATIEEAAITEANVGEAMSALKRGEVQPILAAFKNVLGLPLDMFERFAKALASELADYRVIVKAGNRTSLALHHMESRYGVEIKLDLDLDFKTGRMVSIVRLQTYDWVTKNDLRIPPSTVIRDFFAA